MYSTKSMYDLFCHKDTDEFKLYSYTQRSCKGFGDLGIYYVFRAKPSVPLTQFLGIY